MPGRGMARRGTRRRTRRRTAAVVGGTAAVVHHGSKKRNQADAEAEADDAYEQGVEDAQAQQAQQAVPADDTDYTAELEKLGDLHEKGVLTDEEFAAKKKEVLAKM
jgi:membrane protease subunit (stomatin/prohibitin family)